MLLKFAIVFLGFTNLGRPQRAMKSLYVNPGAAGSIPTVVDFVCIHPPLKIIYCTEHKRMHHLYLLYSAIASDRLPLLRTQKSSVANINNRILSAQSLFFKNICSLDEIVPR